MESEGYAGLEDEGAEQEEVGPFQWAGTETGGNEKFGLGCEANICIQVISVAVVVETAARRGSHPQDGRSPGDSRRRGRDCHCGSSPRAAEHPQEIIKNSWQH